MDAAGAKVRRRIVEWEDPVATARRGRALGGREYLGAILEGRLPTPPIAALLGFSLRELGDGFAAFTLEPGEHLYNPLGVVHGGVAATLLDSVMACAIHTTLPKGRSCTTLEIKVNLVRAITEAAGTLRAEGSILHGGRQVATAEGRLVDAAGRLCAHGTTTCLVFDIPEET